ncbi:hypothetical protein GCM10010195_00260 [Kitasatospora griseola]|nr:hypothetical protein GCM10010195_00260 [Kitasatospora griseola]
MSDAHPRNLQTPPSPRDCGRLYRLRANTTASRTTLPQHDPPPAPHRTPARPTPNAEKPGPPG